MPESTIFDSVFKTMAHKMPKLLVPFVNEVFDRNHLADESIVLLSDEHEGAWRSVVDDSAFRLGGALYHLECQSNSDSRMAMRMLEYDFSIALEDALSKGVRDRLEFPASCVLYLRQAPKRRRSKVVELGFPDGESVEYRMVAVDAQAVESGELFSKHLVILLPFYLMRYEDDFEKIARDEELTARLVAECVELRRGLARETLALGDASTFEEMIALIIRVSDYLLRHHESLKEKVRAAMGGEVLELMSERAERLEREGLERGMKRGLERGMKQGIEQGRELGIEQGRELGIEQGRELGIEQGREQAFREVSERLAELGVDESVIAEAVQRSK